MALMSLWGSVAATGSFANEPAYPPCSVGILAGSAGAQPAWGPFPRGAWVVCRLQDGLLLIDKKCLPKKTGSSEPAGSADLT